MNNYNQAPSQVPPQQVPSYANVTQQNLQSQAAPGPFNFTGRQQANAQTPAQNIATNLQNPGVMTNQFRFGFGNHGTTSTARPPAPVY